MVIPPDLKADWLNRIDEHKGTVSQKYLMVPYRIDDVYNAILKWANERITLGDVYQEDRASNSVLFGAERSKLLGGLTFKGYSTLEPTPDGGTLIYIYVKVVSSESVLQELLNNLTDVLEKDYAPSTSVESLVNSKNRLNSPQDIQVYGSREYDSTKNIHNSKWSAFSGIRSILIGSVMLFAGFSGHYVLRFTNSSEALVAVALLILAYGFYQIISAARMNKHKSNIRAENPAGVRNGGTIDSNLSPQGKTFANMNKMDNNGKMAGTEPVISNPVNDGKTSFKEKLLKNKLPVGIIIILIIIIALVLSNPFSSNGYPRSDITGVTLTITDVTAYLDDYSIWCEITPMPDHIDDFKVVANYYDSDGDLVVTANHTIDPPSDMDGEIKLDSDWVDMDFSKVEVILLDPESKFVASDELEIAS
jgi:hypothetical protein